MTDVVCPSCGRAFDATASICVACRGTLEVALANVASYHAELETLRSGQVRFGSTPTRGSGERRLGMDARFAPAGVGTVVETATRNAVVGWVRYVLDHVPPVIGPTCALPCLDVSCSTIRKTAHPRDTVASCCAYLLRFSDWLRVSPVGPEVLADISSVERRLRSLVDRPADQWYAGKCGSEVEGVTCSRELYAADRATNVRCRDCGSTYEVEARRKALLAEAEDREATVRSIVRIVTTLGDVNVSEARIEARINTWVSRERLVSHGRRVVDGRSRRLYRVGDVLDLLGTESA